VLSQGEQAKMKTTTIMVAAIIPAIIVATLHIVSVVLQTVKAFNSTYVPSPEIAAKVANMTEEEKQKLIDESSKNGEEVMKGVSDAKAKGDNNEVEKEFDKLGVEFGVHFSES
jgi:hypothetical protein